MTAGIQRFQLVIDVNFFARLQPRQQTLVLVLLKLASVQIDGILGINPVTVRFEQPVNAIRSPAFFVRSQRENQIAVRQVTLFLQADETCHQQSVTRLHVFRATAVKIAILFDKNKRIGGPVFASRLNDVQMSNKQNWLARASAMVANDEIFFVTARTGSLNVFSLKSGFTQPFGHRLRGRCHVSNGIGGVDFDQLPDDIVRKLLVLGPRLRGRAVRCQHRCQQRRAKPSPHSSQWLRPP